MFGKWQNFPIFRSPDFKQNSLYNEWGRGESGRSWVKVDGPKRQKVDGPKSESGRSKKTKSGRSKRQKVDGPKRWKVDGQMD